MSTWLDTYSAVCYPHYCLFTLFISFLIPVYIISLSAYMLYAHVLSCLFTFTKNSDSLDLYIQICGYLLLIKYLEMITCVMRSWSLFFLIIGILALLFMVFLDSIYIVSSCHFFPLFICYHCVRYSYVILWYWFKLLDFIPCSGYLRYSVYAWGIFLAYIRRLLLSQLCFHVL